MLASVLDRVQRAVGRKAAPPAPRRNPTGIALVGCGYVADLYLPNLENHPGLAVVAVFDRDVSRAAATASRLAVTHHRTLEAVLGDPRVQIVVNLTNPRSHFEVSKAALEAGKHVYTEKPLAMRTDDAFALVERAERSGLQICGAPCNVLSETAQTLWKAIRDERVGRTRLVYAEMDDGLVHRFAYKRWLSRTKIPWPYRDEFEVGCTLEHAGYYLGWLLAFFGPVRRMSAFSKTLIEDKVPGEPPLNPNAPDFSVACLEFDGGVVARLTCSIVAEHDHAFRVFAEDGVMTTRDCWFYREPIHYRRRITIRRKTLLNPIRGSVPLLGTHLPAAVGQGSAQMDFFRGVDEMADAIHHGRTPRLSPRFSLHLTEVALAIHEGLGAPVVPRSSFEPMRPMPWAE